MAISTPVYNLQLFQELQANLQGSFHTEWLVPLLKIVVESMTKLFLDDKRPYVGLIAVEKSIRFWIYNLLIALVKRRIKNDDFASLAQPWEFTILTILLRANLDFYLCLVLLVTGLMVLSEFKDDWLINLAMLTRLYDVLEVHTSVY